MPRINSLENKDLDAFRRYQDEIGDRIRWAREVSGYSQVELARELGISQTILNRYERGKNMPSLFTVATLASKLRLSADYFVFGSLTPIQSDQDTVLALAASHPELVDRRATGKSRAGRAP